MGQILQENPTLAASLDQNVGIMGTLSPTRTLVRYRHTWMALIEDEGEYPANRAFFHFSRWDSTSPPSHLLPQISTDGALAAGANSGGLHWVIFQVHFLLCHRTY